MATVAGVGSTSTNRLQTTVPSIPNARAVGPPTGRSTFLGLSFCENPVSQIACPLAQLESGTTTRVPETMALAAH
jgi:hypothetical protein